jgi:hypothetical protein
MNKLYISFFVLVVFIFLANSSSQPTNGSGGYTGAPNDGFCGNCHSGTNPNLDGEIMLSGIPTEIVGGQSYPLTVTITNPNGNASKAGFQLVSLRPNITNAGEFSSLPASTIVKSGGGKKYFGHSPAKIFPGNNTLTYEVNWTPNTSNASGEEIIIYAIANIANGNGSTSGDRIVTTNFSTNMEVIIDPLEAILIDQTPTSCFDTEDGAATVLASGGIPPYNYSWDNGETNETALNLSPGLHDVEISDMNGDVINLEVTIESPNEINITEILNNNTSCNGGEDGYVELSAFGGTGNLNYLWNDGSTQNFNANLSADGYEVSITDENGCETVYFAVVEEPEEISLSISQVNDVTCFGEADGIIFVEAQGGNGNFNYQWSNNQNGNTINNLIADDYILEVIDQNNCSAFFDFVIAEPSQITASYTSINASCVGINNGQATLDIAGGSGIYSFVWSNGEITNPATQLSSGNNTVMITDSNDCSTSVEVIIYTNNEIEIFEESIINNSCFGGQNGSITINSDTPGLNYEWSNGETGLTISNLVAGEYQVLATNDIGCESNMLSFTITDPLELVIDTSIINNLNCFEDSTGLISLTVSGGTGTSSIIWTNGSTSFEINNLPANEYGFTINDENNCELNGSYIITQPDSISTDSLVIIDNDCFDEEFGSITAYVSGGTGVLDYLWSTTDTTNSIDNLPSGNYSLMVSDENNCIYILDTININQPEEITVTETIINESIPGANDGNVFIKIAGGVSPYNISWSTGETTDSISNLSPGTYNYTITDSNGCITLGNVFVSTGDCAIEVSTLISDISCFGETNGSVEFSISNSTEPFSISWQSGQSDTAFIDNLEAGVYNFTITDDAGCTFEVNEIEIYEPDSLQIIDIIITDASNNNSNDGSIQLNVIGGTQNYSFEWYNDKGVIISNTKSLNDQFAGDYYLIVTDSNDCIISTEILTVDFLLDNKNVDLKEMVVTYPNPARELLRVKVLNNDKIENISIFNLTGQEKLMQKLDGKKQVDLDVSTLENGIYFIIISTDNESQINISKKIMVMR